MSALEVVQLLMGSGVLAHGVGVMRWALKIETRVSALESRMEVAG